MLGFKGLKGSIRGINKESDVLMKGARYADAAGRRVSRPIGRVTRAAANHPVLAIAPFAVAGAVSGLEPRKTALQTNFGQKAQGIFSANALAGANRTFGDARTRQTYNTIARQHPYYWGG